MNEKIKQGKYQHYKGKFYKVLFTARNSETLEEFVVYQGLYNSEEFGNNPIWIRPLSMFLETINIDGKKVPRFKFMEK